MATQSDIEKKYASLFAELQQVAESKAAALKGEGEKLGEDAKATFKVDLTVRWVDRKIVLNLPQVTMRTTSIKLDLPEVTSHLQEIIFSTPSTRMVLRKVGQYPEFHGFNIVWKDILTEIPEIFMEEQRIKLDIPEIRMTTQEIKLDYPDFSWGPTEMVLRLPEVEVKDISFVVPIDDDDVKHRSEELRAKGEAIGVEAKSRAESLAASMKAELVTAALDPARALAESAGQDFATKSAAVADGFNQGIAKIDGILSQYAAQLPAAQVADLQARKGDLVARREEASKAVAGLGAILTTEQQELAA